MAITKKETQYGACAPVCRKKRTGTAGAVRGIALSFLCGAGCCLLLLCGAALAFAHTALPLALARPAACAAAAGGAFVSGWCWRAAGGRRKLLAGLGCGGFYCACLLLSLRWQPGAPRSRGRVNCRCCGCFAGRYGRRGRGGAARPGRAAEGALMRAAKTAATPLWRGRPRRKGCRKCPAAGAGGRGVPGAPQTAAAG